MSIRTSFNPLGTLGSELPYIQPLMTGPTTWSNTPSFGCTVTTLKGNDNYGKSWEMLGGGSWGNGGTGEEKKARLTFARPLTLESVAFTASNTHNLKYEYFRLMDADDQLLAEVRDIVGQRVKLKPTRPVTLTRFSVAYKSLFGNGIIRYISNMIIKATYKP